MTRMWSAITICVALTAFGYFSDLPKAFGAHPFWSQKLILIGAPIGLILGLLFRNIRYAVRATLFLTLSLVAFVVASWGKETFTASFAEDVFAGQAWYFGWCATAIFSTALIFSFAFWKK